MDKKLRNKLLATLAIGSLMATSVPTLSVEAETVATAGSTGQVSFTAPDADDRVSPVNPTDPDPDKAVEPIDGNSGTTGPLSIDFASNFNFGQKKISNKNETYHALPQRYSDGTPETVNYVQVSDRRGTLSGWTLEVSQAEQLATTDGVTLEGAEISLRNITVDSNSLSTPATTADEVVLDPEGDPRTVMSAASGAGAGTFVARFGDELVEGLNQSVELTVPGKSEKLAAEYTTQLTWTLADTPPN